MVCTYCGKRLYIMTWRDPKQKNRNVYVACNKRYRYCGECEMPIDTWEEPMENEI